MRRALFALILIGAVGAAGWAYYVRRNSAEVTVNTSPVTRGDIVDTVGATGTLQAVTTVQVGTQVSGIIQWLGADFNSIVRRDQVIARLDPSLFEAQVKQAEANLVRARADLERNRVQLSDAQTKYARAQELASRSLLPLSELDAAKVAVEAAQAQVQASDAQVTQSEATLNQNQVNLTHTIITAPIDGIVTSRNVDVGQTVAASLQSPTLFVIAADLTKMQVNANVDEADVGRIRPNQAVTFTVDAYPGEPFRGTVSQVRLQPVVVQNVTTYGTIIDVPNPALKLKPGMTANIRIEIARRTDVVRVPNAALRFRPTTDMFAALNQTPPPESGFASRGGRGAGLRSGANGGEADVLPRNQPQAGRNGLLAAAGRTSSAVEQTTPREPASPTVAPSRGVPGAPAQRAEQPPADASRRGSGLRGGDFDRPSEGEQVGRGRGGFRGDGAGRFGGAPGGGGGEGGDGRARMMDRFRTMSPEEQKQFIVRMKERGVDVSAFEAAVAPLQTPTPTRPAAPLPQTIDALFAPLPPVESRGRVWLHVEKALQPVNLRLGITDGTNTELLTGELQPGQQVVTGVIVAAAREAAGAAGTPNPLNPFPQRGGRGGFSDFFGGGGRRGG